MEACWHGRTDRLGIPSVAIVGRLYLCRAAAALALALGCEAAAHAQSPDATEIMRRNYAVGKVTDSRTELTLTLISADGAERKRATESTTKLQPNGIDEARLVRFTSPADIRATSVLMIEHSGGDDDVFTTRTLEQEE